MSCFAKIAAPLYDILCKGVKYTWSFKHTKAINALQKALPSPLVLCLINYQRAFKYETNASDYAICSVLLMVFLSISRYQKALDLAQYNYFMYNKETYSIITSWKHFRTYKYGKETSVVMDHHYYNTFSSK